MSWLKGTDVGILEKSLHGNKVMEQVDCEIELDRFLGEGINLIYRGIGAQISISMANISVRSLLL